MPPTLRARDLRPLHPPRPVRVPHHGPGDAVEVRGPPAPGFELVRRAVEGGGAGCAGLWGRGFVSWLGVVRERGIRGRGGRIVRERGIRGEGREYIDALGGHVFVVFARVRGFGSLLADDAELLGGEDGAPFLVGFRGGGVGHCCGFGGAGGEGAVEGGIDGAGCDGEVGWGGFCEGEAWECADVGVCEGEWECAEQGWD